MQSDVQLMLSGSQVASEFALFRDLLPQCAPLLGWLPVENANGPAEHTSQLVANRRPFPPLVITAPANPLDSGTTFTVDGPTAALIRVGDVLVHTAGPNDAMMEVTAKAGNVITVARGFGGTDASAAIFEDSLTWLNPPVQQWSVGAGGAAHACDLSYSMALPNATPEQVAKATQHLAILGLSALERQILFGIRSATPAGMKNCNGILAQIKADGENVFAPGLGSLPPDSAPTGDMVRVVCRSIQAAGGLMPNILVIGGGGAVPFDDWHGDAPAPQEFRTLISRLAVHAVGPRALPGKVFALNSRTTTLRRVQPFSITSTGGASPTLTVSAKYAVECDPKTSGVIEGLE